MPDLLRARLATAAIVLAVVMSACGYRPTPGGTGASPSKGDASRCASSGTPISLSYNHISEEPALFTVDGSELVFAADGFPHGGILDPKVGSTAVYVVNPDRMPVFSEASGHVTNVTHEFGIDEGQETNQILPAGRYWLATSNFVVVTVRSCPPGGVTLLPSGRTTPSPAAQTPGTSPRAQQEVWDTRTHNIWQRVLTAAPSA